MTEDFLWNLQTNSLSWECAGAKLRTPDLGPLPPPGEGPGVRGCGGN